MRARFDTRADPASSGRAGGRMRLARRPIALAAEPVRAATGLAGFSILAPLLVTAPRGDGHAVLVLPGWLTADASTLPLRSTLRLLGYDVHGWKQGINRGPTVANVAALRERLSTLARESGGPVSVIGWSLGGIYAYELASRSPAQVRQVITLGSPARSRGTATRTVSRVVDSAASRGVLIGSTPRPWHEAGSLRVPVTAVYSRGDGVVPWQRSQIPAAARRQNVQVNGGHLGLGHNPAVVHLIADRLAQPVDQWKPFRPGRLVRHLYP